ncbi:hypothetical protein [Algoriphagus hitonicola]|uniref:Septum formation inhibitor Maf n=1 Tax=Algoriphagus hitonicola TaxID=435880 RepID=A0A1I2TRQ1_9BACT|nr:hypothetical protein [Algoriphagus hitonicola]SFG65021.1 hypothetical protein SAMN04487988_10667 [Algoriphagus hitonicola]
MKVQKIKRFHPKISSLPHLGMWISIVLFLFSCGPQSRDGINEDEFAGYWYKGLAEINVFDLTQMRYGEERRGNAVMIFVTEDFSRRKQVKLDDPGGAGADARKVMKLNMTRDFVTGVYPYHTMLSVFTPVNDEVNSFKLTASVTEWCGQAFTQMNWRNSGYLVQMFSYFESEGDQELKIDAKPEDELFNLIRLNPDLIPTGDVRLIPSLIYQRFSHTPLKAERAEISIEQGSENTKELIVEYPSLKRTLTVRFKQFFPYEILSWEEVQTKPNGDQEITKAVRKKLELLDYWEKNESVFEPLRKDLGF